MLAPSDGVLELRQAVQRFYARDLGLSRRDYEFQMLLGVDEPLRKILVGAGHRMRVYVPYGEQWYEYSVRRLKENPKVATYVARDVMQDLAGYIKK